MLIKKNLLTFNVEPCQETRPNDTWFGGTEQFWKLLEADSWEPETFKIFDKFLSKDHSYLDIGAWVGPTVLYGSQLAKSCYAFEADPKAFSLLKANVGANKNLDNIQIFDKAIAHYSGKINFGTNTNKGDSMSSLLWQKESWSVDCISIADFIHQNNIQDINFIKIDIEGGEAIVLPASKDILQELQPTLYLSLHIPWFNNAPQILGSIYDTISFYKYIYLPNGVRLNRESFLKLSGFTSVIVTNIETPEIANKKITFCLTSCNRFDLLQRTLDSFFSLNLHAIDKYLIVEDSGREEMKNNILSKYGDKIELIFNETNLNVNKSIDKMYAKVETPYIFHCEDDWLFRNNQNFIKESMDILEERPDIHQVWLIEQSIHGSSIEPQIFETSTGVKYKMVMDNRDTSWCGFSNNPGLRRTADYRRMFPNGYGEFYDPNMFLAYSEWKCSANAQKFGYRAAILLNSACEHIGTYRAAP